MPERPGFSDAFERARAAALQELQRDRQAQIEAVPLDAQLWLAVVPSWTLPLAEVCGMPTGRRETPASTLDRLTTLGLVERGDTSALVPTRFWMTDAARADYQRQTGPRLVTAASLVARRILGAGTGRDEELGQTIPLVTWRWALVARRIREVSVMEKYFTDRFREALDQHGPDDARVWLQALRPLDPLVGGQLTTATQRAIRALALHDREENDRAFIAHYLIRDEQLSVYRDLVNGPDTVYALHYLGGGGVGKTMLMRYLTSQRPLMMSDGTPLPERTAARIDFDYVNPDYPGKRPGLLLTQLAEELRVKDLAGRTAAMLEKQFFQKIRYVNQQIDLSLAGERRGPSRFGRDAAIESILREPLDIFADACQRLERPPLLILDTCEELARLGPDNQVPASVERTFELLDALHTRLPKVRVIFSGRRPLAQRYANTGIVGDTALPARTQVHLAEILAFTAREGARFLKKEGVSHELARPILERSRAVGYRPLLPVEQHERFSPFSLSLYAGWVRHRPKLKPEEILNDPVDQFVRIRILERVRNPHVRDALPAVALLGRFDLGMLQAALDLPLATATLVMQELGREEWIDRQASGFLQIEPDLRDRLRVHFLREQHGSRLERTRTRLVDYLEPFTLQVGSPTFDTGRLDVAHIDVLARLLESDPERAARWWERLEARCAEAGAWNWVERTLGQLVAPGGALASRGGQTAPDRLRITAQLTLQAVRSQLGREDDGRLWWGDPTVIGMWPDLDVRGFALAVASGIVVEAPSLQRAVLALGAAPRVSMMPGLLAAGEKLVEWLELVEVGGEAAIESEESRAALDLTVSAFGIDTDNWPRDLKPLVLAMRARAARLCGRDDDAKIWWLDLRNRLQSDNPIASGGYLDWVAPADPRARLRLEYLRAVYPRLMSARQTVDSWVEHLQRDSIDADRVRSAMLRLMAALETPKPETFEQAGLEQAKEKPTCEAHRALPPSFLVRAENRAARGDVGGAQRMIDAFVSESLAAGRAELAQAARLVQWRIARRMRLPPTDDSIGLHTLADDDVLMAVARQALTRASAGGPSGKAGAHALFRTSIALPGLLQSEGVPLPVDEHSGDEALGSSSQAMLDASLWLDAVEIKLLDWPVKSDVVKRFKSSDALRAAALEVVRRRLPMLAGTAHELCLRLRLEALGFESDDLAIRASADRLGVRAAALVALDEGELLALRSPSRARTMIDRAAAWFGAVDDVVGTFLCAGVTTLAAVTDHREDDARVALARAQAAYTRLQSRLLAPPPSGLATPLTPWSELEAIAANPSPDRLGGVVTDEWRCWQYRVIACMAALNEHRQERLAVLHDFLEADAGAPEFRRLFDAILPSAPAAPPSARPPNASENMRSFAAAPEREVRLAIACEPSRGWWPVEPQPGRLSFYVDSLILGQATFTPPLDRSEEVGWNLQRRVSAWRRVFDYTRNFPPVDPKGPIDVILERPHAWLPWELLLPLSVLQRPSEPPQGGLVLPDVAKAPVFRRYIPRTTTRTLKEPADRLGIDLIAPDYLQHWLREVWARLFTQPDVVINTPKFKDMASGRRPSADRCHVVALICTPIETSSGVVLAVNDERFTQGNGAVLQASQLARWAPEASLVILQLPPTDPAEWGRAERDPMICLRLFAAELFVSGVPSVLVLPPSDRWAMAPSWDVLADMLARKAALLNPLLAAAMPRLRDAIANGTKWAARDHAIEAALSVAWYSDEKVPWFEGAAKTGA